ncbi:TadE/TadG family type IV pilus assembly protein [Lichenifustis flavocetrariae]|uniref:Pilus assembly protein TadG-related protein n=1 Tax=Lichenifustis flavocetrariae TaxID=2949735 RepID=A0AA41Z761_9HYPH|nr:pilus assembly protein TadG-related protein [Lichenifustis flavocetrariae]MCW6511575.1 pilus assembly protein TadG-related protein [Lichenifustis flavocetrariae]
MQLKDEIRVFAWRSRTFWRELRGNVSILFALSLVPMIGVVGLGVDYGIALSTKSKLDSAADAAALAAVATAKAYVADNASDNNVTADAIAAGLDRAKRAFAVNAAGLKLATAPTPAITLTRTGQTFASNVSYSSVTSAQFGRMFGTPTLNVAGTSAARADVPSYLDFYLFVDESGSMGIPTAAADQTTLANVNGGCQFACHFSDPKLATESAGNWGYNIATTGYTKKKASNGTYVNDQQVLTTPIQLRSGAVNNAICQLLTRAASPAVANQYRVGIYPFINQVATLAALTTNIPSLQSTADCSSSPPMALTSLLDPGVTQFYSGNDPTTGTGSGGTHFESALPGMQAMVSPVGDGSSAVNPKPFVFLITDGMDNGQHYSSKSGSSYRYVGDPNTLFTSYVGSNGKAVTSGFDGSSPQIFNSNYCSQLKSAGITLSILYIPYVTLAVGTKNQAETITVDNLIPGVSSNLQACASSGFFYTASSASDITAALSAMFNQAVQVAHLSK